MKEEKQDKPKVVELQNLKTGLVVIISYKTAKMLETNYPKSYKILSSLTPQTDKG